MSPVTLAACPIGLFISENGTLCLKTEYGNNEGRIDAYIISSGEFFWGTHPQTIAHQREQLVTPIDEDDILPVPKTKDGGPLDGLLEPASRPYSDAALISIAISLKRLADHLAPNDDKHQAPLLWLGDVLRELKP